MKKKNVVLFGVTALAALTLAACSSSGSSSGGTTTISLFNIKTETAKQLDSMVKDYESTHKNVKIDVTTVGGGQDARAALKAKFTSGDEPTIFMMGGLADVKTYKNKLADISDGTLAKDAIKGTLDGATLDGKAYGVPVNIEGFGWIVNKAIFKKAGIDVDTIKSFADFKNAVETLDAKKSELGLKGVFAYSGAEKWVTSQFSSEVVGPEFGNSLSKTFTSRDFKFSNNSVMKDYIDLANKYNASPFSSLDYTTSVSELFAQGKAAIIHQGNWIVPTLNSIDPNIAKEQIDILPTYGQSNSSGYLDAGASWYWGVNKTQGTTKEKAAEDFLTWMYTDKVAMKQIINDFQYVPAYTNFNAADVTDPISHKILTSLNAGKTIPFIQNAEPDGWGENTLGVQVQAYASGQTSWDKLVETVTKDWNSRPKP
ncbi:MAG: extracellular solute-binding protein [Streptococcaceae bacterium]|jgi:raffinose/stachyose/melibiose transport system substrate-binding protein|nr:extracellular solute-binding protein [Streptococcaceae bacterium]